MIWTKINYQKANFQIFKCSRKISPNLYFDRLLLLKVYKISAKKESELSLMTLKSDVKFKEKLSCCFKNDNNLVNFDSSAQKSQKSVPFAEST